MSAYGELARYYDGLTRDVHVQAVSESVPE